MCLVHISIGTGTRVHSIGTGISHRYGFSAGFYFHTRTRTHEKTAENPWVTRTHGVHYL
jgi:hypothetical protein